MRLTAAQALIAFPRAAQHVERDGKRRRFSRECWASSATATSPASARRSQRPSFPYHQARNEQARSTWPRVRADEQPPADVCVHHVDRARSDQHAHRRRAATVNRCRCCCCRATCSPGARWRRCSSSSSTRPPGHLGQRLLQAGLAVLGPDQSARATDRVAAGRDARADLPAETGAVTLALPRTCRPKRSTIPRRSSRSASGTSRATPGRRGARAPRSRRSRRRQPPLIVAGGGVHLQRGDGGLPRSHRDGIPVGETQAARERCRSTTR